MRFIFSHTDADLAHNIRAQAAVHLIALVMCNVLAANAQAQATTRKSVATQASLAHTVQPNDKLITLGTTLLNSALAWPAVAQFNGLKNPNLIYPGQRLNIPLRYLVAQASSGKVISISGGVSLDGQRVSRGAAVGEGSLFKTGNKSTVVVQLGDASHIKLLPNTLAEVVTNRHYALRDVSQSGSTNWLSGLMHLSEGALEAFAAQKINRADPLTIQTPTSLVGVRSTQFRVALDEPASQAARTEVLEGRVRADNPAQAAGADLPMGTGAVVKPLDKAITVINLLTAPNIDGIASEVFQPHARLSLPPLADAAYLRVLIANDDKFDNVILSMKVPASTPADLSGVANGNWYALVRSIDGIGLEGFNTVKQISKRDAPVTNPWRAGNALITLAISGGKTFVSWTAPPSSSAIGTRYAAVLGTDQTLQQASISADSTERKVALGLLQPGNYFIRLRFTLASGKPDAGA